MTNTQLVLALDYGDQQNKNHIIKSNVDFFLPDSLICMTRRKNQEKSSVVGATAGRFKARKDDVVTFVVTSLASDLQF